MEVDEEELDCRLGGGPGKVSSGMEVDVEEMESRLGGGAGTVSPGMQVDREELESRLGGGADFLTSTLGGGSLLLASLPPREVLELESRLDAGLEEGMEGSTSWLQEVLVLGSEEGQGPTFMVQPCILVVFVLRIR